MAYGLEKERAKPVGVEAERIRSGMRWKSLERLLEIRERKRLARTVRHETLTHSRGDVDVVAVWSGHAVRELRSEAPESLKVIGEGTQ